MRYDAVLFDLDGTLIASAPGVFGSVRHTLAQLGEPEPDDETLRGFVGPAMHVSLRRHCGMDDAQAERAVAMYREHFDVHGVLNATVYPGVPALLRRLREAGVYVAIASAKPLPAARKVLEHLGLLRFFDRVIGAEGERRDDDKQALLRAALPARYTRAAMVGDRRFDMEAARALGLDAIGAGWGYGTPEELREAGAGDVPMTALACGRLLLGDAYAPPRGFFISIEGLDGSGKTTQMNAVAAHMRGRGYDVLTTREPGGTPISEDIRHLVLSPDKVVCPETEALLYAAARAQHVQDVIRPGVEAGRVVLCDRFVDSSIVYQGAGRGLGIDPVRAINAFATGGTMPDLTLLLIVDAREGLLRRNRATALDRIEQAGEAFFRRVYDAFGQLQREAPERIRCVDASQDIQTVTDECCAQVDRLLATR